MWLDTHNALVEVVLGQEQDVAEDAVEEGGRGGGSCGRAPHLKHVVIQGNQDLQAAKRVDFVAGIYQPSQLWLQGTEDLRQQLCGVLF